MIFDRETGRGRLVFGPPYPVEVRPAYAPCFGCGTTEDETRQGDDGEYRCFGCAAPEPAHISSECPVCRYVYCQACGVPCACD